MPGSGKSTLGKGLAAILQLHFVDLDAEIESKTGLTIALIFQDRGEEAFRELERDALAHWLDKEDNFIMATGGGTPCFHDNLSRMNNSGLTVFVDVPLKALAERMKKDPEGKRPLLGDKQEELPDKLASLLTKRRDVYGHAQLTVDGLKPVDDLANLIKKRIRG